MFSIIAAAIQAGQQLHAFFRETRSIPRAVIKAIESSQGIWDDIQTGRLAVTADDGAPMTAAEFAAKYAAWEAQQAATSAGAAGRIEARHAADGTGEP